MALVASDTHPRDDGYSDEERAVLAVALQTLPERHAAVGVSVHGDLAWVCTTPTREKDPGDDWDIYGSWVDIGLGRKDGEWQVWHHSLGGWLTWWSPDGYAEGAVGVLALVDDAPPAARAAEVRFQGRTYVAPVRHGAFFFAIWDQASPDDPPSEAEFEELQRLARDGAEDLNVIEEIVEPGEWPQTELPWRSAALDDTTTPVVVRFID